MIEPIIPSALYRSPRPGRFENGIDHKNVPQATVDRWIKQVRSLGVERIICLLDETQLAYYAGIPGGLIAYYEAHDLEVIPLPTEDHKPIPQEVLTAAYQAFCKDPCPTLVHCSAGAVRSRTVAAHILEQLRRRALPLDAAGPGLVDETATATLEQRISTRLQEYTGPRSIQHLHRVTGNALLIYDALQNLHGLAPRFRRILWAAAQMHDLGTQIRDDHHGWLSADDILDRGLGDATASAPEIALVASLHRAEEPVGEDAIGEVHPRSLREIGDVIPPALLELAGMLRVADGLDRYAPTSIREVHLDGGSLVVLGDGSGFQQSRRQAIAKAGLLRRTLDVELDCRQSGLQPPRQSITPRPVALFDLQGTLVHHRPPRQALPGITALLQQLRDRGWKLVILSGHTVDNARAICRHAALPEGIDIRTGTERPDLVGQVLAELRSPEDVYYIDDKPEGIRSVHALGLPALQDRIIPFVGSARYAQEPAYRGFEAWCLEHNHPIARTVDDLAARLLAER